MAMHVGDGGDTFFIPIKYLGHTNFKMLLREVAQEFVFGHWGSNINQLQDDDDEKINYIDFLCWSHLPRLLLILRSLYLNRMRSLTNKSYGYSSLPSSY
mgnify:CR=1 FL=1